MKPLVEMLPLYRRLCDACEGAGLRPDAALAQASALLGAVVAREIGVVRADWLQFCAKAFDQADKVAKRDLR